MINDPRKDIQSLKSKASLENETQGKPVIGKISILLNSIEKAQCRIISNIERAKLGAQVIIILIAIMFLAYAFGFRVYKVYDKPAAADNGMLSTFNKLSQANLMEELAYDAIINDPNGNLINKGREAHCLT